jgi:hypothetical protein
VFEELDELARGLAENEVSRRQALKWAGYAVAGATLSSMGFADTAEALTRRARRRCRRKGGTPLEKGNCHCAWEADTCSPTIEPNPNRFTCQNDNSCTCYKTTEGRGFCGQLSGCPPGTCSSSSDCPPGWKCAVNTCCSATPSSVCIPPCGLEA